MGWDGQRIATEETPSSRPNELLVELKGVDALTRNSNARSLGRMRVASGVPRVEVLERGPTAA